MEEIRIVFTGHYLHAIKFVANATLANAILVDPNLVLMALQSGKAELTYEEEVSQTTFGDPVIFKIWKIVKRDQI